jgi:hypothetical protein
MECCHGNTFLIPVVSVSIFSYPEYLLGYGLDDGGLRVRFRAGIRDISHFQASRLALDRTQPLM